MSTVAVFSLISAAMGFIAGNVLTYRSFGSLEFWDVVVFGVLGACIGALIGLLIAMVVVSIVF